MNRSAGEASDAEGERARNFPTGLAELIGKQTRGGERRRGRKDTLLPDEDATEEKTKPRQKERRERPEA